MDKFFCLQTPIDKKSNIPPLAFNCSYASSVTNKNAESTYNLRNPLTVCGIHLQFCGIQSNSLYLLVAESATKQVCRQNLSYRYMYAESTEILFVESTYILEYILDLSLESMDIQTQNCAPIQCIVWPRNVDLKNVDIRQSANPPTTPPPPAPLRSAPGYSTSILIEIIIVPCSKQDCTYIRAKP